MGKQMKTYYIDEQVVEDINATAKEYGISQSLALELLLKQLKELKKGKNNG